MLDFEREDDVVVEAEPDVGGAPSRVEVANDLDVGVANHLAMSARKLEREHLLAIAQEQNRTQPIGPTADEIYIRAQLNQAFEN